ncbi:MAG: hypothetical protein AB7T63_12230 [Planctomycetota bacterium]
MTARGFAVLALEVAACVALAACGEPPTPVTPFTRVAVEGFPGLVVAPEQVVWAERFGAPVAIRDPDGRVLVLAPAGRSRQGEAQARHEVRIGLPFYVDVSPRAGEGPFDPAVVEADAKRLTAADPIWTYRWIREGEWEHAARAGTEGTWPTEDGSPWREGFVNRWGLVGLGQHAEVVADHPGPLPVWDVADPTGPADGAGHVVRGLVAGAEPSALASRGRINGEDGVRAWSYRLVAPMGYGLGAYGRHAVRFRLVGPGAPSDRLALHLIRMENRLGERSLGRVPVWERLELTGDEVHTRLVPGRYYIHAAVGEAGASDYLRGLEVKFTVDGDTEIDVPRPGEASSRFGDSSPQ